ncbi:MAG TPA: OmpA family protein [Luteibaculaceae bacterium]|nr:OmpA family protein [Luteibaculaceae bacterium]
MSRGVQFWFFLWAVISVAQVGAQANHTSSLNEKFVAICQYDQKEKVSGQHVFSIDVFSVAYRTKVQHMAIRLPDKSNPDSLYLSPSGKLLYLQQGKEHRVYNVRTGQLITKFPVPVRMAFANQDNYFVVSDGSTVTAFDGYTAEALCQYQTAPDNAIERLMISADDAHIFAQTGRKQILVWKKDTPKPRKKYFGDQVALKPDGSGFSIIRTSGTALNVFVYGLPAFNRINKLSLDKTLREEARRETLERRKLDPSQKSVIVRPPKVLAETGQLSDAGDFLAYFVAGSDEEKRLQIVHLENSTLILDDVVGTLKQDVAIQWYNDSLLIPVNAQRPGIFNAKKQQFDNQLEVVFDGVRGRLNGAKMAANTILSPDFNWGFLPQTNQFLLKNTVGAGKSISFENHRALEFSSKGKYLFVQQNDSRCGFIDLKQDPLQIVYFDTTIRLMTEQVLEDSKLLAADFQRITGFKHIREARAQDSLQLVMKTVESGNLSGVQVQIIDRNGVYYYGANEPEFKRIWCNLMVKGSDGKVRQIDDFEVEENSNRDSIANAVSVVLDFSGSMGWARADAVQDGAEKLIKRKLPNDEMGLIKYDHRVVAVSKPQKQAAKLLKRLFTNDYSQFAGGTALLDAINAGIFQVKDAEDVGRKMVIVLTDGLENSSLATRNEVLANAVSSGVNLFTIGFGSMVDESYLKSLAYTTYGGHYQIGQTPDFDWVFTDIYLKATNYYSVRYKTEDKGSMVYVLKLCLDGAISDTLAVEYENAPADVQLLRDNDAYVKANPVKRKGSKDISLSEFDFPELSSFERVVSKSKSKPSPFLIDEDRATRLEEEFETIELPRFNFYYDKTETVQQTERRIGELAAFLKRNPDVSLQIIGHTDNSGSLDYNQRLSEDRANLVKDLIVRKGVDSKRIKSEGYGETSPIAENDTEEGRAKNRRVEFRLIVPEGSSKQFRIKSR